MNKRSLGVAALAVSTLLWLAIFVLPWAPLEKGTKFGVGVVLYGGSYLAFFAGGAWLGPEVMGRLRARFRGMFRRGGEADASSARDPLEEGDPLDED